MKIEKQRQLTNAVALALSAPEIARLRQFLQGEAASEKPEADEIIKYITDEIRGHLVTHWNAVRAMQRGV